MSGPGADYFSALAQDYERFRPRYPAPLFKLLAGLVPTRGLVWDCASGNGQAALPLAALFTTVVASDTSFAQLAATPPRANLHCVVARAESVPLPDASADLITVAQALHWFDLDAFFAEARRVLKPGGLLAVWTYNLFHLTPQIDALVQSFYRDTVGAYWPAERRLVDEAYAGISLPFAASETRTLPMTAHWKLAHLIAYLGTWSAVTRFRRAQGHDPVAALAPALASAWGSLEAREVSWPLTLKLAWQP